MYLTKHALDCIRLLGKIRVVSRAEELFFLTLEEQAHLAAQSEE
jgi:hypothetical protein